MLNIRHASERGHFDHGWLNTYHTFSFGAYHDAKHMGFRSLRVMNEDRVQPGQGFGTHGHSDMEIVTYVLEGALAHKDSMGNGSVLRPGEFQRMSAGSGIQHSEFNDSNSEPVHFYQIWLLPRAKGGEPSYEQKNFPAEEKQNTFRLVADPDGNEEALRIGQDARIYLGSLEPAKQVSHAVAGGHAWVQVLRGSVNVNGIALSAGDGVAASDEPQIILQSGADTTEVMLFDLT